MPTSAAGIARAPAAQKTAAAMEAGFAKGGLESTIEGTLQPSVPAPAQAAAPASNGQAAPPVQQAFSPFTASIPCLIFFKHDRFVSRCFRRHFLLLLLKATTPLHVRERYLCLSWVQPPHPPRPL